MLQGSHIIWMSCKMCCCCVADVRWSVEEEEEEEEEKRKRSGRHGHFYSIFHRGPLNPQAQFLETRKFAKPISAIWCARYAL